MAQQRSRRTAGLLAALLPSLYACAQRRRRPRTAIARVRSRASMAGENDLSFAGFHFLDGLPMARPRVARLRGFEFGVCEGFEFVFSRGTANLFQFGTVRLSVSAGVKRQQHRLAFAGAGEIDHLKPPSVNRPARPVTSASNQFEHSVATSWYLPMAGPHLSQSNRQRSCPP